MEKDKVILEIKSLVNKYNRLINEKSKPKYGLKTISFSEETGLVSGEYHKITNYSIWEIFSAPSLDNKLLVLWDHIENLSSYYATNFCGITESDMTRIRKEKEILGLIDQYNNYVNLAIEKGKVKEGYLPISFDFQTGKFTNPWHDPYSNIIIGGIEDDTNKAWQKLVSACGRYLSDVMDVQMVDLLQRKIQWHIESWNTWCEHEKNNRFIKLNEDTHQLEGHNLTQEEIESSKTAKALYELNMQLEEIIEIMTYAGYSLEEMSSVVMTDEMEKICFKKKTLRSAIDTIESLLKKYNDNADSYNCPRLRFDKQNFILSPSIEDLVEAWEKMAQNFVAKYDNFLSRKAEDMAANACQKNVSLLNSIFSKVSNAEELAVEILNMEMSITRD